MNKTRMMRELILGVMGDNRRLAVMLELFEAAVLQDAMERPEPEALSPPTTATETAMTDGRPVDEPASETVSPAKAAAQEKKICAADLATYRQAHGLGCYASLAAATNGVLSADDIREMASGGRRSVQQWRVLRTAIDYCKAAN